MTRPADHAERQRAVDPAGSFIVQAPAGSGKTELLIQRYLALLGTVDRPEEILAITFTRKAAGEMRDRVLSALERAGDPEPPDEPHLATTWRLARVVLERDEAENWGLAGSPSRLQVMTIDAFNALLVRRLPLVAGVGGPVTIAEDPDRLYDEAARRTLGAAGTRTREGRLVRHLLEHLDNDFELAAAQLVYLLARRDHWLPRIMAARAEEGDRRREVLEASLRREITRVLGRAARAFPVAHAQECADLAAYAAGRLAETQPDHAIAACRELTGLPDSSADGLPAWRGLTELLLIRSGAWRKSVTKACGFPTDDRDRKDRMVELLAALAEEEPLREALGVVRQLPPPAFDDEQWAMLDDLLALLPICAGELALVFRRSGQLDYVALAQHGREALGRPDQPTDLALALDYRIRHVLVDEFQDVSAAQVELLKTLTAGWTGEDGRTLFFVGDPMQSIYRFREADVALYLRTRAEGLNALTPTPLTLAANFRSRAELIHWFNPLFADVFPDQEEATLGAVPYAASDAARPPAGQSLVTFDAAPNRDRNAEAAAVAERIGAIRRRSPAGRIAVLVRARPHLAEIARELRRRGVRYEAVEIEPLVNRQPIQDLLALTRALSHLDDRTAWLAVLRAPWCGLCLDDLARIGSRRDRTIREALSDDATLGDVEPDCRPGLARLREALDVALSLRGRRPLHRIVEGLWQAVGGPATMPDAAGLADADRFFDLVRRLEVAGELPDPALLEARLSALYAAADAGGGVQLMTIHKAKGLEFDHVFLPGLDRRPRGNVRPLLYWHETIAAQGHSELLLAPLERRGADRDPLQAYIADVEKRRDTYELQRLLYVAATRAREGLHLSACLPAVGDDGTHRSPVDGSLLALLWPTLSAQFVAAERAASSDPGFAVAPAIRRLAPDWERPPPPPDLRAPGSQEAVDDGPTEAAVAFDWAGQVVRVVGTIAHRYFERMAADGIEAWDEERVRAERPRIEVLLAEGGVPASRLDPAAARVMAALENTLRDPEGRWILSAERTQAATELPVAGTVGGRTVHRRIDRSFVDDEGVRWIVDFKVSPHESGDVDVFLREQEARYRPQLDQYARLLAGLYPGERKRRAALYFPLQARLVAWDVV